jgi:cytoskeletal protein RodZ
MYKKEIMVGLSIFFLLLVGAWWLNEHSERNYGNYQNQDNNVGTVQIQTVNESETNDVSPFHAPFKPREYIRVNSRPGEN